MCHFFVETEVATGELQMTAMQASVSAGNVEANQLPVPVQSVQVSERAASNPGSNPISRSAVFSVTDETDRKYAI